MLFKSPFANLRSTQHFVPFSFTSNLPSPHSMKFIASISAVIATGALTASADVATGPTWGYRAGDTSMVHTSNWNTNWAACGGAHQSPINIVTTTTSCSSEKLPLNFSGRCGQLI